MNQDFGKKSVSIFYIKNPESTCTFIEKPVCSRIRWIDEWLIDCTANRDELQILKIIYRL